MSKLFTYLNIKEGDLGLIDGETQQMAQVVEMMQGAYKTAPDGRKKEVLANMISETVALVLARLNSIEGLSKDAKKKVEEENKELPKERSVPKFEPQKEQKQEPQPKKEEEEKEEPKKEDEIKVGDTFFDKRFDKIIEITKTTSWFVSFIMDGEDNASDISLEQALDYIRYGVWVKGGEKKEEPKKEEKYPFKVGEKWYSSFSNNIFKIEKIYENEGIAVVTNVEDGGMGNMSLSTIIERINDGKWTKIEGKEEKPQKEEKEPKKEEPKEQEEELTQEEIKEAIDGLRVLVKMGDEEAKKEIKRLKALIKK